MTLEDIDDVMVLEKLSFTIPWSRDAFVQEITNNKFAIYISAKLDGRVIGYAGMWKVCDEGHVTNVAVHPEFRRSGVGCSLVEYLITLASKENIERMTLEVRRSNIAAQELYSMFGFKVAGCRKGYYSDNGEDAIIMWKDDVSKL
jgi:ribosomal-protein-alanine N-acetyltransferase